MNLHSADFLQLLALLASGSGHLAPLQTHAASEHPLVRATRWGAKAISRGARVAIRLPPRNISLPLLSLCGSLLSPASTPESSTPSPEWAVILLPKNMARPMVGLVSRKFARERIKAPKAPLLIYK